MPCPPPPYWRLKHVHALRVLFRYAAGTQSSRSIIPGWVVHCQELHRQARRSGAAAPRPKSYIDQLSNFKAGVNNLEFVDGGENPKLDYVRQKLWEFYDDHEKARADVFDYYKTVYSTDPLSLVDIKLWLAEIYQAQPGPRALARLRGAYHLYRFGLLVDGKPSVVRSAMRVDRDVVGDSEYLTFQIAYPNTSERGNDQIEHISGIVLSTLGHYYFIGADSGAAASPYQLIAKHHSSERAPTELSGLFMRHSLRNEVIAARALIVRISADEHGEAAPKVYEDDYQRALKEARVLLPKDVDDDRRLDKRRLAKFRNIIEERRAPVLWLVPDDTTLPPPPPMDERPDRDRPRRRSR